MSGHHRLQADDRPLDGAPQPLGLRRGGMLAAVLLADALCQLLEQRQLVLQAGCGGAIVGHASTLPCPSRRVNLAGGAVGDDQPFETLPKRIQPGSRGVVKETALCFSL